MATRPEGIFKGAVARWLTLGVGWLALPLVPVMHVAAQSADDTSQAFREKLVARGIAVGSVMAMHRTKQYVLVDTHVNPSAGRLYVLSHNAERVVTELPGWVLRVLPNDVVLYHRNQVHFAPTHSAELWTWDPATRRHAQLYSSKPFDTHIGDSIVVRESGRTIAFPIVFDAGDGARNAKAPREIVVTCRGVGTKRARCTEQAR
jgi:hypothetical protein